MLEVIMKIQQKLVSSFNKYKGKHTWHSTFRVTGNDKASPSYMSYQKEIEKGISKGLLSTFICVNLLYLLLYIKV